MWLCFGAILCGGAITDVAAEISWELGNGTLQMKVERQGAMISDLRLVAGGTHWLSPMNEQAPAEPFGHFLCFDRWGPVTAAEAATGFSFHGEAARVPWAVLSPPTPRQLEIKTHVGAGFQIRTAVQNPTSESRPYNVVEHITLADTWADASIRIITNAGQGILHEKGEPVRGTEVEWPWVTEDDQRWDLRRVSARRGRFIASLRFPAETQWGYVALQDPRTGALLAYVWPTEAMPWLNLYWFANGERVVKRAIEPGTTGLHRPMAELLTTSRLLDLPVVHWLAPAEKRSFVVAGGLALGPSDFGKLRDLQVTKLGWAAVDETGQEVLLVPYSMDLFPPP